MKPAALTAVVVGSIALTYTLLWSLNYRNWTARSLRWFYRTAGSFLWPGGDESSYVFFMRHLGWFGVAISLAMVATGLHALVAGS